ncbi:hypothetical protein B0H13DRAFT_1850456 [Mycena leptocephala]|nr:hypothetical protein B0H13DRAFT_1850456 [Mycena leptocephala]
MSKSVACEEAGENLGCFDEVGVLLVTGDRSYLPTSKRHRFSDVPATAAPTARDVPRAILGGWLIPPSAAAAAPPAAARQPNGIPVAPHEPDVVLVPSGQRRPSIVTRIWWPAAHWAGCCCCSAFRLGVESARAGARRWLRTAMILDDCFLLRNATRFSLYDLCNYSTPVGAETLHMWVIFHMWVIDSTSTGGILRFCPQNPAKQQRSASNQKKVRRKWKERIEGKSNSYLAAASA